MNLDQSYSVTFRLGHPRPIVPRTFQRQVFETIHNLAHPGRKATVKLVAKKICLAWSQETGE